MLAYGLASHLRRGKRQKAGEDDEGLISIEQSVEEIQDPFFLASSRLAHQTCFCFSIELLEIHIVLAERIPKPLHQRFGSQHEFGLFIFRLGIAPIRQIHVLARVTSSGWHQKGGAFQDW
jgi:hypothetical protein